MLVVAALELSYPVLLIVLMEADNAALHGCSLVGRVERTSPVWRSALCSPFLSPFGIESVTVCDRAPVEASPSQKPASGFPAQASSWSLAPDGVEWDQGAWAWERVSGFIPTEALPRETTPLAAAIQHQVYEMKSTLTPALSQQERKKRRGFTGWRPHGKIPLLAMSRSEERGTVISRA